MGVVNCVFKAQEILSSVGGGASDVVYKSYELTCKSCLAASAPALVLNVTKPTGCDSKNDKLHFL